MLNGQQDDVIFSLELRKKTNIYVKIIIQHCH